MDKVRFPHGPIEQEIIKHTLDSNGVDYEVIDGMVWTEPFHGPVLGEVYDNIRMHRKSVEEMVRAEHPEWYVEE